ncbi:unnamed protein product [Sphenostylis stenocarpa]|uniref:Transcription repressor n=1 Tax=Sphenostylis stenocarpa TaxID=92480 RepID=A0AA86RR22_9FABA|nr:unnamed protein product [Sphenostylis stenocarpa]
MTPNMPQTGERRKKRNNLSRLNLNLCFSYPMQPFTPQSSLTSPTATSSTADQNQNPPSPPATSPSPIKNFNYDPTIPFLNLGPQPEPADLASAFASQRFFFTCPGRSNSIVESTITDAYCTTSSSSPEKPVASVDEKAKAALDGSVAVTTYSPDPYADFRRSMEEMVAARPELMDVAANWKALHELLLCYLALNPKSTHKFILCAFSDLLLSLISLSSPPPQDLSAGDVAVGGGGCSNSLQ